jgi:hypothetical protein
VQPAAFRSAILPALVQLLALQRDVRQILAALRPEQSPAVPALHPALPAPYPWEKYGSDASAAVRPEPSTKAARPGRPDRSAHPTHRQNPVAADARRSAVPAGFLQQPPEEPDRLAADLSAASPRDEPEAEEAPVPQEL